MIRSDGTLVIKELGTAEGEELLYENAIGRYENAIGRVADINEVPTAEMRTSSSELTVDLTSGEE